MQDIIWKMIISDFFNFPNLYLPQGFKHTCKKTSLPSVLYGKTQKGFAACISECNACLTPINTNYIGVVKVMGEDTDKQFCLNDNKCKPRQ